MIDNLGTSLPPVASWVIAASWKALIVIPAVLLCRVLLKRWLSAHARYSLWLAVMVCLIFPFGVRVNLPLPDPSVPTPETADQAVVILDAAKTGAGAITPASSHRGTSSQVAPSPRSPPNAAASVSPRPSLMLLWAGVAIFLSALAATNFIRYRRIRQEARAADPSVCELFFRCKEELGIRRKVEMLETPRIDSPMVLGCWSPTLLLPPALHERINYNQLRHVFLHELAHVRRQDVLVNWLMAAVQILHWFNPLVWYALRKMRADMEQACDATVLHLLSRREQIDYGSTLITLTDSRPRDATYAHGLGIVESHLPLKERIAMIAAFKPGQLKYSFLTVAILTALTSVALTQPVFRSDADAANTIDAAAQPDAHPTDQRAHPPPAADTQLLAQTAVPASKSSPPKSPATAPKPDPAADTSLASAGPKLPNSIPMPLLMQQVSKNIGKKIVSPPGAGNLFVDLYGQEMETIDYPGLLTILKANGLTAFELNGYVSIVQLHDARSQAVPTVVPGKQYPDDQFVSMSIFLKHANAAQLTPVLRPLMPAHSFMSADVRVNSLLLVDTYANVMRIKSIVEELDAPRTQPPAEGPVASGQ